MVRAPSPAGGWVALLRLLALGIVGACLVGSALPALADAEGEYEPGSGCPRTTLEVPEEMPQPDREIRGLRNDTRAFCEQSFLEGTGQLQVLEEMVGELQNQVRIDQENHEIGEQLLQELGPTGEVPVVLAGQRVPVETVLTNQAESSTEGNFEGLEQMVLQSTETTNSDLWGIAGLFVGFLTLAAVYKLVRP